MIAPLGREESPPEHALLEALPAPAFVVQQQRFVFVNAAFAELMGLEREALLGHDSLERVHPDDRQMARSGPWPHRDGSSPASTTQLRVRRGDGAERSIVVTTVKIGYKGAPALLGSATDVTLQPNVVNMSVRLAALGRLAGGIAHDFNNLLTVIGGQLERLGTALPPDSEAQQAAQTIAAAAERAALLTDKLLSFGRRQMLAPQVLDMSAFTAELEPLLRQRAGEGIDLRVRRDAEVPAIRADRPRLREVLWHLVDNARDAMPGGGTLTIAIDRITVGDDLKARWSFLAAGRVFVRLRVIDTGRGMNPDIVPHVFEPFFTTKGRGRGAGMGLASVYGIVKQSAGYVFVEGTGTEGTCVTILLPPAAATEQTAHVSEAPTRAGAVASRPRILLVEDDMAVRELLVDVLEAEGFVVSSAETAEQAESQASDQGFDLLLSDIDLPGMSGARLAAALRARQPAMRLMLMSGYPDDGALDEAGLEERPVLLRKPFSTAFLVEQVREALR